ncbi:MAG: hypothetical protein M1482_07280 [Chloroflexi bacterium]|nr:hypothetical protein [Chloroflexota bacterium]
MDAIFLRETAQRVLLLTVEQARGGLDLRHELDAVHGIALDHPFVPLPVRKETQHDQSAVDRRGTDALNFQGAGAVFAHVRWRHSADKLR